MFAYILKRLLLMIPTLLGVLLLTFVVIQFVPGGPVEQYLAEAKAGAVTSPQRNPSLPNVPTFSESGIEGLKGFDVGGWYGVYGPKNMPADLTAKLNKATNAALAQPELKAKYKDLGYDEWVGGPEKLAERAAQERQMWSTVTQGIVID